ncbi:MAG: gamma-glutamyltransferase [Bdellovibrionaceae bacterium]|nr:gamma-glutamyltransferase [Pseudobdellovibrionaceae bacterium]
MYRLFFVFSFCFLSFFTYSSSFKAKKFIVSGPSPHSPIVAQTIFNQGGNLVDMAVASAFALAVTHPYYVSLGSGGFALIKVKSEIKALDFRETAPHQMPADFFEKTNLSSIKGGASVGVPGFLAGMRELNKKYGKLSWSQVIAPALLLAKEGFFVSGDWLEITNKSKNKFNSAGKKIFFKNGKAYKINERFKQPGLAKALKLIQTKKTDVFYKGEIGKDIVSAVVKEKGILSLEDLKKYRVRWLEPVSFNFRGYKIYSMPLPSSGALILERAFKLIDKKQLYKKELYSFDEIHLLAEIMSRAFLPRMLMGDPAFSNFNQKKWLSDKNLSSASQSISLKRALKVPIPKESEETTHISLMDAKGNAVSMTLTLNGFYGSHVVSPKYGIVLNNQMDDFTTQLGQANMFGLIQGKNNSIQGGKRPLSSMTPTIVEQKGETIMAIGGAGGPKIITAVLQTIYRYLINKMNIEQAISSRRIHHQFLPRKLFLEDKSFSPEQIVNLKLKGHKIEFKNYMAQIFAVTKRQAQLEGASDNRREGAVGGL